MELLQSFIKKIGISRLLLLAGLVVGGLIFASVILMRASSPEMALLFANVDPGDGAKILERLKMMNIPSEVRGEGDQIYAPAKNIAKLRMELAADGLPAGGTIGYELFDKTDVLGTTNAMMDINLMRAVEGEVAKSIKTIQGVQSARVHLVIPKKELFSNDKQLPSASIALKMKGMSRLSVNQVLSIQHLVASAVPNLTLDRISIIDDKGTLLAKGQDGAEAQGSGANQHEIQYSFESKLSRSIESLLERTVGAGKVRTEVSVDMDFDKITSTSVEYNPDGQVARSQQNMSEGSNSNEASIADTITVQNAQPDANAGQPGTQSKNQDTRNEENVSYEISNTTKTHVHETGNIKRLSIAVLVDGTYTKDKDGKDIYAPRSAEEIAQITDLVKTAAGFDEKRGDTVKVINMQFNDPPEEHDTTSTFQKWMNLIFTPKVIDMLLMIGAAMLLYFSVARPMILRIASVAGLAMKPQEVVAAPPPVEAEPEPEDNPDYMDVEHIEGKLKTSSVKKIGEIIELHPDEAINIIRSWMYSQQ